jgi:Xaa-Pro aminopeptidase
MGFIENTLDRAWEMIRDGVKNGKSITELDVQEFIMNQMVSHGYQTEGKPIVAAGLHSADAHYSPNAFNKHIFAPGDIVMIDLWAKQNQVNAIYADITQMAVIDSKASEQHQKIFSIVKEARDTAFQLINHRFLQNEPVKAFEVDEVCRDIITSYGYGNYFIHRSGHSISTSLHGKGPNLDSLETLDDRPLVPGLGFSIEPGIYLPGKFGIRLEYNVFIHETNQPEITGNEQDQIICLFS